MPQKNSTKSKSSLSVIDLLTADHEKVMDMFAQFKKLKQEEDDEDNNEAKQALVTKTCTELTIHAQVEEELFYPALRDLLEETDLVDEAEVEHSIAKQLIGELASMEPGDELYDAKFTVLGEYIQHHIEEEQEEIFPKAKKAKMDVEGLGTEVWQRKEELRMKLGIPAEEKESSNYKKSGRHSPA